MAREKKPVALDRELRRALMERIVAEHETRLLRYAARIVADPVAAQDVVQNVFIKLFRNWNDGMRPSPKLGGWLYRVTHNDAIDHVRREKRIRLLHERHAQEAPPQRQDGRNCPTGSDERKETVLRHLRELDSREQRVVLLRLEAGLSYRQISEVTGRSEGNVGNILHHAVRKLSEKLRSEEASGNAPDPGERR